MLTNAILNINFKVEIITNNADLKANAVLNLLREKIKMALHQTGKQGEANDGMDVAFCILHKDREKRSAFRGHIIPFYLERKLIRVSRLTRCQ